MKENKRDGFGTKLGIVAAAAGSAVGLGNIYRFPCELGAHGGGAFLLVYLIIVICLGMPIIISEFVIGRRGQSNAVGSFKKLVPNSSWSIIGYLGVLCAVVILAFYSTIAGWTLEYVYKSISNDFIGKDLSQIEKGFSDFCTLGYRSAAWQVVFIFLTAFIIIKGVSKGIERYSSILMPLLFVILIVLAVKSLTLDGSKEGLVFLLKPDFSKITGSVLLSALGQAFFSLSVGMGALITYGSYISKKDNMTSSAVSVCLADTCVAVLAGIIIFPAAFSMGIRPEAGMGLVFNTLPMIFNQMTGGYFFCLIFFVLLAIAALTSTISLLEVIVAFITEEFGVSRVKATIIGALASALIGVFATLSLREGTMLNFGGKSFFDLLDFFSANILLPIGALLIVIFIGWKMKKQTFYDELTNQGTLKVAVKGFIFFIIKYIAPLAIMTIFINNMFFNIS